MAGLEKLAQFAGVALFGLAGAAAVQLLPALRELPRGRRLAYAYLLGVAWVAGSLYALSHFLGLPLRRPAILIVASLPLLAWLARLVSRRLAAPAPQDAPDPGSRGLRTAAFLVGSIAFLAVLPDVLVNPLRDWDGRMTWCPQARYIREEGTVSPTVLTQRGWFVSHPWYPVLMPVAQVAVLEVLQAGDDDHYFRGLYAFFFPAWLLILYGGARRWTRPGAAAWTAMAASLFSVVSIFRGGGATSAYSDLPLACFFGAGLLLLLEPRPRLSAGLAAGLLLGAAALTKSEGAPLALWALVVAAAVPPASGIRLRSRWRPFALAGGIVLGALILLLSWRAGIPERYESYGSLISWSNLWPGVISRAPLLLAAIRKQMIAPADWGIFWSVAPVVLLAGWRGLRRRVTASLLLAAAAPLGIAWIAYSLSLDPLRLIETTWNRFILQASVPLLVLVSLALDDLLHRAPWVPSALGGAARSPSRHPGTPARNCAAASPSSPAPAPPTA
jgi:hypothetical protein